MTLHPPMLRRIDQGEAVETAVGTIGGDGQIHCVTTIIAYPQP